MRTALNNIRRSPYRALMLITVLSLNLFITAVFALVSLGAHIVLSHFETRPQIIAYLKDDVDLEQINQTINQLTGTGQVKDIVHISKQQALELYKQSVGNDPLLLGTVTELGEVTAEILPASLEISAKSVNSFDALVQILEKSDIVSVTPQGEKEIDFPRDIIDQLVRWTTGLRLAGLVLVIALTIASVVTVSMTISMKIASRRLEINTLKLIGARQWFIVKPYLQESIIYTVTAAFFGWLFTYIALLYSTPFLVEYLSGIISSPLNPLALFYLWLSLTLFALVLGLVSGLFAAIRFARK